MVDIFNEAFKEILRTIPCGNNDGNKQFYKNVDLVKKGLKLKELYKKLSEVKPRWVDFKIYCDTHFCKSDGKLNTLYREVIELEKEIKGLEGERK